MLAAALLACMVVADLADARARACRKACGGAKAECLQEARDDARTARQACAGDKTAKRACRRAVRQELGAARSACVTFRRECGACCAAGGTLCSARCGDGTVTPEKGEQCDPPGSACAGGGACDDRCQCPTPTTTTVVSSTTTTSTSTTTLPQVVRECFEGIATGNLRVAAPACVQAAANAPGDGAVLLAAAGSSSALALLDDAALADLGGRAGIARSGSAADVCALGATLPDRFPATTPRSALVLAAAGNAGIPALGTALAVLESYTGGVSRFDPAYLPSCIRPAGISPVEIDAGDVLVARALARGLTAGLRLAAAYDLDVTLEPLLNGGTTPQLVYGGAPGLLTRLPGATFELAQARTAFQGALDDLIAAVASIDAETDDQSDDLLVIDPADHADVLRLRDAAARLRIALSGEATFEAALFDRLTSDQRMTLNGFFGGEVASLRPLVPTFDATGVPDPCTFPDYTFGGVAPDLGANGFRRLLGLECK